MNTTEKLFKTLPYELVNVIFEYDGRIKYKYNPKNSIDYHKYVNVIHKYDERYNIITPIIDKKIHIMKETKTRPNERCFYFEFAFDNKPNVMLCYDYNYCVRNRFEICYADMGDTDRCFGHVLGCDQIRTIYK